MKRRKAMKILILFLLLVIVVGCKNQPTVAAKGPESLGNLNVHLEDENTPFIINEGLELNDTLFASIEKGVCFGNCKAYKMNIYSEGVVMLTALRGTKLNGTYKSIVSYDQMNMILAKAKEIKFENMEAVYDNKTVTDLPMVKTSIVLNGRRKAVKRRYEYPKEILELEKIFDNLLDELTWEKIKGVMINY